VIERGRGIMSSLVAVPHVEDLLDGDGTPLIIDEAPDNLAPGSGDSGARIVCGTVGG
jgi:Cu/Zn superoxide dismutase